MDVTLCCESPALLAIRRSVSDAHSRLYHWPTSILFVRLIDLLGEQCAVQHSLGCFSCDMLANNFLFFFIFQITLTTQIQTRPIFVRREQYTHYTHIHRGKRCNFYFILPHRCVHYAPAVSISHSQLPFKSSKIPIARVATLENFETRALRNFSISFALARVFLRPFLCTIISYLQS